jgi:hypothetical protein
VSTEDRYTARRLADGDVVVIDAETGLITGYFGAALTASGLDEAWCVENARENAETLTWQSAEGLVFEGEEATPVDERYVLRDTTDGDFAIYDTERKMLAPFHSSEPRDAALALAKTFPARFAWASISGAAEQGIVMVEEVAA